MFVLKSTYDRQVELTNQYIDECVELHEKCRILKKELDSRISREIYDSMESDFQVSTDERDELYDILRAIRDFADHKLPPSYRFWPEDPAGGNLRDLAIDNSNNQADVDTTDSNQSDS